MRPRLLLVLPICGLAIAAGAGSLLANKLPQLLSTNAACRKPDGSQVRIVGGTFRMGSEDYYAEEGPVREISVRGFSIDRYAVTNAEFAHFVSATGYLTDAERVPDPVDYPEVPPDRLVAGGAVFIPPDGMRRAEDPMEWWQFVPGANWRHPEGPKSDITGKDDYPVVQVSYRDALAYAHWKGRELPTEEQFEYAARGGLDGKIYAWGDALNPGGKHMANTWQGEFPGRNLNEDGFAGAAPAGCFPPNGYGLYDMIGNVWEWTATPYGEGDGNAPPARLLRTIKGGSFLCAPNYCRRYRPAARQPQESGFSALHLGFRTVDGSE